LQGVWLVRRDVYVSRITGKPPGVGAPAGTPVDAIDKLNKEINAGVADAKIGWTDARSALRIGAIR
jgi:hypothetical protein